MDGQAVKEIAGLEDKNKVIEVGGKTYSRTSFSIVEHIPRPEPISGLTLTGLMDYIESNKEQVDFSDCLILVANFSQVSLVERFKHDNFKRTTFFKVELDQHLPVFKFDTFMPVEEFIIKVRALFQQTADLDKVVSIVSRVVAQNEISAKDDGLSQTVLIRKGASGALSEGIQTQGMYELKPYRTFREIEQPTSSFILRLKPGQGDDSIPTVALFDSEGGAWRHHAMMAIKNTLKDQLEIIKVIIPVLA